MLMHSEDEFNKQQKHELEPKFQTLQKTNPVILHQMKSCVMKKSSKKIQQLNEQIHTQTLSLKLNDESKRF